jgi:hypothetical protein
MHAGALATFGDWETFYVIMGSSAAALTGLQFVVIALIADQRTRGSLREIEAFGTPTIVHFCAALASAGLAVALTGLAGVAYDVVVIRRARGDLEYKPVLEDWIWHTVLPMIAYAVLFLAGAFLTHHPLDAPFFVGGAVVLLVFIGIHNAWDAVTYITLVRPAPSNNVDRPETKSTSTRT